MAEQLWLVPDDDRPDLRLVRERLLAHGAKRLPSSALVIEDGEGLRNDLTAFLDELALEQDACTYNGVPGPHAHIDPWAERLLALLRDRAAVGDQERTDG